MVKSTIYIALAAFAVTYTSAAEGTWNYKRDDADYGTSAWSTNFPQCALSSNSPIDFVIDDAVRQKPEAWTLTNWDKAARWTIYDNDYTIKYSLNSDESIKTAGGNLGSEYKMLQFHFHWGASNAHGSEHLIDGKAYPMEVHFVHQNTRFTTLDEAIKSEEDDALAAVGFFFVLQDQDNAKLDKFVEGVRQARVNTSDPVKNFELDALTEFSSAATAGNFFRYYGGLTTPACQQIVKWTVFETPIAISAAQMEVFRNQTVMTYGTEYYRDVVPVGSRVVTLYDMDCGTSLTCGATSTFASLSLTICLFALSKLL